MWLSEFKLEFGGYAPAAPPLGRPTASCHHPVFRESFNRAAVELEPNSGYHAAVFGPARSSSSPSGPPAVWQNMTLRSALACLVIGTVPIPELELPRTASHLFGRIQRGVSYYSRDMGRPGVRRNLSPDPPAPLQSALCKSVSTNLGSVSSAIGGPRRTRREPSVGGSLYVFHEASQLLRPRDLHCCWR